MGQVFNFEQYSDCCTYHVGLLMCLSSYRKISVRRKLHDSLYVTPPGHSLGSPPHPEFSFVDDSANLGQLLRSFIESNTGYEMRGENGAQVLERAKKIRSSSLITNIHV